MKECIFCKIINKEIPSTIVFEDENVIAFLDVNPKSDGHTLVVPKIHYDDITKKQDEIDLLKYVNEVVGVLKKEYKFSDFKILINTGKKAGQEVFHTHIHIIPH